MRKDTYPFAQALIDNFKFHLERKKRAKRVVLPPSEVVNKWVNVRKLVGMNDPKLRILGKTENR